MHLNDEQIQRFLHGELDARAKETLSLHVAGCDPCSRALAAAEHEERAIFDLLRHVDHPAPAIDADSFVRAPGTAGRWGRRAAGFVIAAALAGAAYAIPGSPLPAVVKEVAEWIGGEKKPPPPSQEAPTPTQPVTSGIAVPVTSRFTIAFAAEQPRGVVMVSLTDGPNVVVRILGDTATFTTDVDRLTIQDSGSAADYEIELPRDAPWVEIYIGTRRLILKDGDRFVTEAPADARGRYVLPLAPAPSHD